MLPVVESPASPVPVQPAAPRRLLDGQPAAEPKGWLGLRLGTWCVVVYALNLCVRSVLAAWLPVMGKEAYFWEWSQHLAAGYLDQPPLVAWLIRLGTLCAGDNWLGLRIVSLVCGSIWPLLLYALALRLFHNPRVAQWTLLLALALPLPNAVGVLMLTETPLLCLYLVFLERMSVALEKGRTVDWLLAGGALGLTLLCKLTAVLAVGAIVLFVVTSARRRHWLWRPQPYLALLVAVGILAPFLIWNLEHDWATFRTQFWERHEWALKPVKILEFGVEQLASTSVLLCVPVAGVLLMSSGCWPAKWRSAVHLLRWQSWLVLGVFGVLSEVTETHPHWTVLAYPPAVIALAAAYVAGPESRLTRWVPRLTALSLGLGAGIIVLSCLLLVGLKQIDPAACGSYAHRIDKARQACFGWSDLRTRLEPVLVHERNSPLLCTDDAELGALYAFHNGGGLVLDVAWLLEPQEFRGHAQRYYADFDELKTRPGVVLVVHPDTPARLARTFQNVRELEPLAIEHSGHVVARYRLFAVRDPL